MTTSCPMYANVLHIPTRVPPSNENREVARLWLADDEEAEEDDDDEDEDDEFDDEEEDEEGEDDETETETDDE